MQKKDMWTVKKMSFSGKYFAKMFSPKKVLASKCIFNFFCFRESCRESVIVICFTKVYSLKNLRTDCHWYGLSSPFLFTMHETDTAAEVYLELFQIYTI